MTMETQELTLISYEMEIKLKLEQHGIELHVPKLHRSINMNIYLKKSVGFSYE